MEQQLMPQDVMDELASDAMERKSIPLKGTTYTIHERLGKPSLAGVTRRCTDEMGDSYAIKFTTYASYSNRASYLDEVSKVKRLRGCPNIARLEAWGEFTLDLPKTGRKESLVILISEYVHGDSLKQYLANTPIGPAFLQAFVAGVCEAFHALKFHGLYHNDLHDRNIIISDPDLASLNPESRIVKLIDTGNVSSASEPVQVGMADHACLVSHLVAIYNRIQDSRYLLRKGGKQYLDSVKSILQTMVDDDVQIRLSDPHRIKEEFKRAWNEANARVPIEKASPPQLNNPFDYIQAEHIVNDKLLEALFSDKCPWYDKVKGPDPVNIDGPRGCGKSTLFRMLRLKTLIHTKKTEEILAVREVGFYVSCTADIGSRFAFLTEDATMKLAKDIVHFFNLVVLSEIIDTLIEISNVTELESAVGWTDECARDFHAFLLDLMGMPEEKTSQLSGISRVEHLSQVIERERLRVHQHILKEKVLEFATPASFLKDVTGFLMNHVSFFANKRILFLLDDYSLHRVPAHIQRVLNHVIWTQVPSYVFKISSEVGGITALAPTGGTADTSREFVEVNIGVEYIDLKDSKRGEEFIADVLDRRLQLVGYTATISNILGKTQYPESMSLGAALRAEKQKKLRGSPVYYHGTGCIAGLCSGDIATTLDIVRHIFQKAEISRANATLISPKKQHEAIQDFSRGLYSKIGEYIPHGKEMKRIVHAFGWASRNAVCDAKGVRKGDGRVDPYEMIRIEVDDDPNKPELPEIQKYILHELLRRAIFIQLSKGRSRHGVFACRLQLRRAYCPAFKMSLSHSEPMQFPDWEHFRYFLDSPREVCERYVSNALGQTISIERNVEQLPMFELLEEGQSAH